MGIGRHGVRHEQLEEREIGRGAQLAGEADRGIGSADPGKHEGLALRRLGQRAAIADHADATGGAAGTAAADAGMRDIIAQARFEHAEAFRDPDRPAVPI